MRRTTVRIYKDRIFKFFVCALSVASLLPLFLILGQVVMKGIGQISPGFFTSLPSPPGETGGGIVNALLGTLMLIAIASVISVPLGILVGILLAEVKNKFTSMLRILVNLLQGIPSIVIGILAYIWLVVPLRHFSALSGAIALAIMMLPIVIKSVEETMRLIPRSLKEASFGLGVGYTRTIFKVILPAAIGGIASGVIIGISRIAGETAPLLFTAFGNPFINLNPLKPVDSLPLLIFNYAMSPYDNWQKIAWGASLVLVIFVLVLNVIVKTVVEKWKI